MDSDGFKKVVRKQWRLKERKQGVDIGESSGVNPSSLTDSTPTTATTDTADKETDGRAVSHVHDHGSQVADGTMGINGVKSGGQQNKALTDLDKETPVVAKVLKIYRMTPKPLKSILKTYNRFSSLGKVDTVESSQGPIQQLKHGDQDGHRRSGEPAMAMDGGQNFYIMGLDNNGCCGNGGACSICSLLSSSSRCE